MREDTRQQLEQEIAEHGLHPMVYVSEGKVVAPKNVVRAAKELGLEDNIRVTVIAHKPTCSYEAQKAEHDVFVAKYPEYCAKCGGVGLMFWTESHGEPHLGGEPMQDWCNDCVANMRCPRCAGQVVAVEDVASGYGDFFLCHNCGATDRDGHQHTETEPPVECTCWATEDWERELLAEIRATVSCQLLVPAHDPSSTPYPAGIEPGLYTRDEVIGIADMHSNDHRVLSFLRDMLEE